MDRGAWQAAGFSAGFFAQPDPFEDTTLPLVRSECVDGENCRWYAAPTRVIVYGKGDYRDAPWIVVSKS